jgi:hypothetical protein
MAIHKKVPNPHGGAPIDVTVPTFSFENSGLADLIVAAWQNGPFAQGGVNVPNLGDALVGPGSRDASGKPTQGARDAAKAAVNFFANMDLNSVVVITEAEHDLNYTTIDLDEVTFVLPRSSRVIPAAVGGSPSASDLLETAKCLMACTPNGI